jgi:hypothetical protein
MRALQALGGILLEIVMCMSDSRRGFGLENGVIDHFNKRLVTTLNYSAIADLHALQITRAHNLAFAVSYSLHQSFPGNGSSSDYSSASAFKSSLNYGSLPTELSFNFVPLITPRHGPP